ncbi:MAG TPA: CapA family protein [Gemmatimonadales bacterium]|nr:CapA family protein [Gemmatimonadales bacterium]
MSRQPHALIPLVGGLLLGTACAPARGPDREVRLLFTGDILLSRQVAVEMAATRRSPWAGMSDLFAGADWLGGNLEGAIGPAHDCRTADSAACFAFPDSSAVLLARAGFDALTLANNHSADLGHTGRFRTRELLRQAGVLGVGFEDSPRFVRLQGVTVAIVAIDLVPGEDGAAQRVPSVAVAQKLRAARSLADLVVVSVHWGQELHEWAGADQRAAADWLVTQGADLIVGHHPHVVQPPECVRGRPVFFSLGNHVFDQRDPVTKVGLIADCRILRGAMQCGAIGTETRHGSAVPVVREGARLVGLEECAVPLRAPLVVAGVELRPRPWTPGDTLEGTALEGWKDGRREWTTRPVELVGLQGGLRGSDPIPYLFALELHPSAMDKVVALRPHVYAVGDHGLIAKWRGTALAWPLLDAVVDEEGELCALHRGDSFIRPDPTVTTTRTLHYKWNGFGFSATNDSAKSAACARLMRALTG